jgi:hypothetical protein
MRRSDGKRYSFAILMMMLLLLMAAPATSFAQGRWGRDRDWNNNYWRHNKKCQKFVNCHDARDGRWDGRGPRGERVGNMVWRNNRNRNSFWWDNRYRRNQNVNWQRRMWLRRR